MRDKQHAPLENIYRRWAAFIARISIIRHALLITHVRLSKHQDSLFCHRVLPRNFTSVVHVCSTSRKIIRKKERGGRAGGSEYLVWHTTLTHPAYVPVS